MDANEQKAKFDHRAAVLATCFGDNEHAYSGGLDTSVRECVHTSFHAVNTPNGHVQTRVEHGEDQQPRPTLGLYLEHELLERFECVVTV